MSEKLSTADFKTKIFDWERNKEWKFEGDLPAIVDFYAEWCGPCKMLGPVLESISEQYSGKLRVYKIDTDAEPELAGMFDIQSVPTLLFIPRDGQPSMAAGALPRKELERVIAEVLNVT